MKQKKQFRELTEEELEKVNGGGGTRSDAVQKCVAETKQKREQELGRQLTWQEAAEIHNACIEADDIKGVVIL